MTNQLIALLDGREVGTVHYKNSRLSFVYSDEWRADSLAFGRVALVYGVDAQKTGLAVGRRLFAFADLDRSGPGPFIVMHAQAVTPALAEVVEVAVG